MSNNSAVFAGGGLENFQGTVVIENSTISGNTAGQVGGAVRNGGGDVTVVNSTISGNTAGTKGGGISNYKGSVSVQNSTISGNTASDGGGIYNWVSTPAATLTLTNSIVANSTNGDLRGGGVFAVDFSLIEDGSQTSSGSNNITGDPLLGPLQDNGGLTLTHALLAGSLAINAGDNSLAVDAMSNPLTIDQRGAGFDRILIETVDIGAFELPPDTEVTLAAGVLTITDVDGADSNDNLTISYSGGTYTITDNGGLILDATSIAGSTGSGTSTVTVPDAGVTGILFDVLGGDDAVTVTSVQASFGGDFTITGGAGADTATINGAVATTGTGAINVTVGSNIVLGSGSSLTTVDGGIMLSANADGGQDADFIGLNANNAIIQTTGTGNIQLSGHGAETGDDTSQMRGIQLDNGTSVSSTGSGAMAGTITFQGTGGTGTTNNDGVYLTGLLTSVTSGDGAITISGTGGNGSSSGNNGVRLNGIAGISSSGTGANAATITIEGTGGDGTSNNIGVLAEGSSTDVTSLDGAISITGIGGNGSGVGNIGVLFAGNTVTAQVTSGPLSVSGTAGSGDAVGVGFPNARFISIGTGTITITAAGSGASADLSSVGTSIVGDATHVGAGSAATGDITINADTIDWTGTLSVETDGALTIQPRTASTSIGLGGGSGTLNLDDTVLSFLQDGFSSITIGDATSGDIDVDTVAFNDLVTLLSGGSIHDAASGTDINAGTDSVTLDGTIAPGQSPGILVVSGNFTFADNSTFEVEIGGTGGAGVNPSGHDQLDVTGTVTIGSNVTLDLPMFNSFTPSAGDSFTIISNDGADAVTGTFAGLAEGSVVSGSGWAATITYVGGDGNDVVLTAIVDTEVTLSGGTLTITDVDGGSSNDDLTISYSGGTYTITDNGGLIIHASSIAGSTGSGTSTITVPDTGVTGILFDVLGGDDDVTVDSVQASLSGNFTITGGTGSDSATINGDVATVGSGAIDITVSQNIVLNSSSSLTTVDGGITLSANASGTATGDFEGIEVTDALIETTGTGAIALTAQGGDDAASISHHGIHLEGSTIVRSTATGASAGTITIAGTGGTSLNQGFGVLLQSGATVTSVDGDIEIDGSGGMSGGGSSFGVALNLNASINSTGTGAEAATITIDGTGGTGTTNVVGVVLIGSAATPAFVDSVDGDVQITGTGTGSSTGNYGVLIGTEFSNQRGRVGSTGDANITITGTGASGAEGIRVGHSTIGGVSAAGDIMLVADEVALLDVVGNVMTVQSSGNLLIQPATSSTTIGLGGGSGTLNLDDTELGFLQDGFSSITIGNSASGTGAVDIDSSTFSDNVTIAGGSIVVTGLDAGSNAVTLTVRTGSITDGGDVDTDVTGGVVTLTSAGTIGGSGDELSLAATSLETDTSASDGDQFLSEADSISVTSLNAGSGTVTISGGTFALGSGTSVTDTTTIDVATGGTLDVNGQTETLTQVTVSGGSLVGTGTLSSPVSAGSGTVAPGNSPGVIATGDLNLGAASTLLIEANSPYTTAGTDYDQLDVTGTVTIAVGATLSLSGGAVATSGGENVIIINNDGSDAVNGTFSGLPEGSPVTVGSFSGTITYQGGDGNDVALVVTGPYSIDGTSGDDDFEVRRVSSGGADLIQVFRGGVVIDSRPTSTVTVITINGDDGDDTLTVNYFGSGGFFTTPITFNGNGETSGDDIIILGGSVDTVTHQFDSDNDGAFTVGLGGQTQTTTYTGLEPVTDNLSATDRVFTFTGGAETITLSDDATSGDGISLIDSTLGESVAFVHPSGSLTINAGSGADTVNLTGLDSSFDADLTVNGDGTASGGSATVSVNGDLDAGSGTVTIGGDGNLSSVSFNGGSLTTTGTVSIATTGAITDGDATVDITAAGLLLSAGGAVGSTSVDALETTVDNLEVVTATSVTITDTDDLIIGGVDAGTTGVSSTDVIMITAGGSLTVNEDVTTDAGTFGDLWIRGGVTVSASVNVSALDDSVFLTANDDGDDDAVLAGTLIADRHNTIRASRDVLISGLFQTIRSDGDITLQSDFDADGVGGVRITTSGQLVSGDQVDIEGSVLSDVVGAPIAVEIEDDGANLQIDSVDNVRIFPVSGMLGDASVVINGAIQGSAGNASIFISSNGDVLFGDNGDVAIPNALAAVGFLGVFADDNLNGSGGITMSDDTHFNSGASDVELLASEDIILGSVEAGRDIEIETTGAVLDGGDGLVDLIAGRRLQIDAGTGVGTAADQLDTTVDELTVDTDSGDIQITNSTAMSIEAFFVPDGPGRLFPGLFIRDDAGMDPAGAINVTATGALTVNGSVINDAAGDITLTASDSAGSGDDLTVNEQEIDPGIITPSDITSNGGMITLNAGDDFSVTNVLSTISTTGAIVVNVDFGDADAGTGSTATFIGTWAGSSLTVNGEADADSIDASAISLGATFNGGDGDDTITGTSDNDTISGEGGDDLLDGDAGDDLFLWSDGDGSDNIDGGDDSDEIDLVSGSVTDVDYTLVSENDGAIDIDGQTITYTNLEPVVDNLDAVNRSFSYTGGTETVTVSDDGTPGDGFSMIDSTLGEVVTFLAPTGSLTIDAGDGDDTLDLQGLDSLFDADLTINGGTGTDSVSASGDTDVGSGTISIGEMGDVESISFDGGSLITTSDVALFSAGAIADNDAGNDVSADTVALGSGSGVGSGANALDTTVSTLEADGGTGGVWISNTGELNVDDINATLDGVTATGDIELTTSGRILTLGILDSNGGNIRITAVDDVVILNNVASDGGNITFNADSDGTGGGAIAVDGVFGSAIVTSSGGNIVLGGGADPTANPTVATVFAFDQGVIIDDATLDAGTGDILIRGSSALIGDAVDVSNNAVIMTTSGNITIIGDSTGGDDGVDIDSESMVSTVSGNITLTGASSGTADEGVALDDMTITTQSGQITITGIGANGSGIHVGGGSIDSVDGDIQLTGTATGNGAVGVDVTPCLLSTLLSLSGAQNVDGAAWNLVEIVTIESPLTIPHITINGTGNDTFDVYSFSAGAGDRGIFDIANNSFDTELFLFDSSFNLLASNDDFGDGDGNGNDSTIDFTFSSSGTFYIVVGEFDSFASSGMLSGDTPPTGETYDLQISIENHALVGGADPIAEMEPNDPVLQERASVIESTGMGSVTIIGDGDGGSAGVTLDGTVGSNSGDVAIQSVDDNVEFASSAVVTSASGMITIAADTAGGNGGLVVMADGSSVDAGSGPIDVSADGDITLSKLQTTGTVTITSTAGSVIDGGDTDVEISAASATITAPGGVGTTAGNGADDAIETAVDSLSIDTSSGDGNQAINEVDGSTSLDLNAGAGTVTLVAGGAVSDGDGSADITADSASVSASGGIAIRTTVTTFAAANDTAGDITVSNSGPLTIGTVTGTVGVTNSVAGGAVSITASSPLTASSDVTASGDITLTATDSVGTGDDLTVNSGAMIQSTGGDVTLRGGDDIFLFAGSTLDASGTVTISGDYGNADPSGTGILIAATVHSGIQTIVQGESDGDILALSQNGSVGLLIFEGRGGDDQYSVAIGNIGDHVEVRDDPAEGNDFLIIIGTATSDSFTVGPTQTVANMTQVITYTGNLETINVDGGDGADSFDVTPSATAEINIVGSDPATIPGDSLTYNAPTGSAVTFSPTDSDTGTISATGGVQDVNYDLVEEVTISGAGRGNTLIVNGSSEDDRFDVDFAGGDSGTIDLAFDADGMPGPTTNASVIFAGFQTVQINAGDGDDQLLVTDPADGVSGSLDFNGEGGSDSIVLVSGTATTLTHNFDNATDGSIDTDGAIINYTGLEPITDNISANNRVFTFAGTDDDITLSDLGGGMSRIASVSSSETVDFSNPSTTLTVNGGDGADTIDATALDFDVTLNGGAGNDSLIGTTGFDQLNGDAGNDTLRGGTSNDTLNGGDDDDLIVWNNGDGSDQVDGDAGTDTLEVNASNASGDDLSIDPNGSRFVLTRNNLALFSLDVGTVETLDLNTRGGNDTATVGDLSGISDLTTLDIDGGDANDTIDLQALTGGPVALVNGGDGDDTLLASTGPEGGDGAADDLNLSVNGMSGTLDYTVNTILVFQATASAGADQVILNGSSDDDALTLDFANGSPVAPGGLFFNGGGEQTGGDNLTLINGTVTSVTHNFTNASDGTIVLEDGGTETITYTGLEPIFDNLSATDRVFNFGATGDDITLSDLGGGVSRIESVSSSETVDFLNPTGTLTINAGDGADTVNVLATAAGITTTVNGGQGSDTINVGSAGNSLDAILGSLMINGDGHDAAPTITLGANTLPQGDVLNINDQGNAVGVTYAVAAASISRTGSGTINYGTVETLNLNAGSGNNTVNAATTADSVNTTINGGSGTDSITLTTTGTASSVVVNGDAGNDTISYTATGAGGATLIDGGADNDTVTGSGSGDNVTILGGTGNDSLTGGSGADSISGGDDADIITGALGVDTLSGGNGDDVFVWDDGDGNDLVEGDAGTDRQIVNAADNAAEGDNISISDNGARIDITRAAGTMLGTFTLDVGTTEIIEVNSRAGNDTIDASALTNGRMDVNAGDGSDTVTGGSQNDTLSGNGDGDSIDGGAGDDNIRGGAGADTLNGQSGNDVVEGQGGSGDRLTGESGDDTLDGGAGTDTLVETADQDFDLGDNSLVGMITGTDFLLDIEQALLTGGVSANVIDASDFNGSATLVGLAGNDTILGGSIVDLIYGGSGDDNISGNGGGDIIHGQGGDDSILGGDGNDTIRGSAGRDTLRGDAGDDLIFGQGSSGDVLQGGIGNDTLDGGGGNDRVYESADTDFVLIDGQLTGGTTGVDVLINIENAELIGGASGNSIDASGFSGFATLSGAAGDDSIIAAAGGSIVNGNSGADSLFGSLVADTINGGTGDDTINAQDGNDIVNGNDGNDLINGSLGADTIDGSAGNDRIFGSTNADYLADPIQPLDLATVNNTDNDSLLGGDGDDTIVGALGSDFVNGNAGADVIDVTSGGDAFGGIDTVMGDMLDRIFSDPTDLLI